MNEAIDQSTEMMPGDVQAEKAGKLRWGNIAIWAVIIIILAALGWGLINVNAPRPEAGQQAPAFEMEFFDGFGWQGQDVATLEEMRGKVVVLNFWASWCVECRLEADLLEQASRAYGDDVVFLGIAYHFAFARTKDRAGDASRPGDRCPMRHRFVPDGMTEDELLSVGISQEDRAIFGIQHI